MKYIYVDLLLHLLSESRYGVNCTFAVVQDRVETVTPWNSLTFRVVTPFLQLCKRTLSPLSNGGF